MIGRSLQINKREYTDNEMGGNRNVHSQAHTDPWCSTWLWLTLAVCIAAASWWLLCATRCWAMRLSWSQSAGRTSSLMTLQYHIPNTALHGIKACVCGISEPGYLPVDKVFTCCVQSACVHSVHLGPSNVLEVHHPALSNSACKEVWVRTRACAC